MVRFASPGASTTSEASACSQVTSLPEVAGDAALLINPYNEQDVAAAMKTLETDEKLRAGLISRGLQRAEGFTWENSARQVLTHLQSLIN